MFENTENTSGQRGMCDACRGPNESKMATVQSW